MTLPDWYWISLLFILGACLGSFGNVIIYRLPLEKSIVTPRSQCPNCHSKIKWFQNIPIFSYIILRGRCANCKVSIRFRYPLVELLTGLLFVAVYLKVGLSWTLAEYLLFCWAAVILNFIDIDHQILPDVFTIPGGLLALACGFLNPERSFASSLGGFLFGGGILWLVAWLYYAIRNEEGMGGGDIKLIAWIGALLGWKAVVFTIIVSSLGGSVFGITFAAIRKSGMKLAIPFGPFLLAAAILYIFVGEAAMAWYLSNFMSFV